MAASHGVTDRRYQDGSYLAATGGKWHAEDASFKAGWIRKILARNPNTLTGSVCEIGCGSGAILDELSRSMPETFFTGYEISEQAHAISQQYASERCRMVLGEAFLDPAEQYDLALCMDVVEHVDDCFRLMRQIRQHAKRTIYHIPLDAHAFAILRGHNAWDSVGHVHLFTLETALKSVEHAGHKIIDWSLTDVALGAPVKVRQTRLMNVVRRPLSWISKPLTLRLVGGYSLIVLAE